jgi:hypothetical protein
MFPDTPKEYFEEHADELVGKPAALDRLAFIQGILKGEVSLYH